MKKPMTLFTAGMLLWLASGCSSTVRAGADAATDEADQQADQQDAGTVCQSGWEPAYGFPFDASTSCVNFGALAGRIPVGCIPIVRILDGTVTCYARDGLSLHVLTSSSYRWITEQGWSECPSTQAIPPDCH